MNGSIPRAAGTGAIYGLLFALTAFGVQPVLPVEGLGTIATLCVLAGTIFAMGVESLGARASEKEPAAERAKRSLIAFIGTAMLSLLVGGIWFSKLGFPSFLCSVLFFVPIFLIIWQGRWGGEVRESDLAKTGTDDFCARFVGFGAATGLVAGIAFKAGFFGSLFALMVGGVIGAVVWMDANERRRLLDQKD